MSLAPNTWQTVPGSRSLEIFPIVAKPSIVSSNCFIVSAPKAILVVDPGASHEQTRRISDVVTAALAVSKRPVLVILTHCHQDHSQEADRLSCQLARSCDGWPTTRRRVRWSGAIVH